MPSENFAYKPSRDEVKQLLASGAGYTIPIYVDIAADLLTPVSAYLKVSQNCNYSFLFESVAGGEKIGRFSFLGAGPIKVVRIGPNEIIKGDPLATLEKHLSDTKFVSIPGLHHFTGGAVGYIAYDCVRYFEPRTARIPIDDNLNLPDAIFMFVNTMVIFDHLYHKIKVVTHFKTDTSDLTDAEIEATYSRATSEIRRVIELLTAPVIPLPPQQPITSQDIADARARASSNVGEEGFKQFVRTLKHHIVEGDIIQAVPSQRLARPTKLHPFNAYRQLRSLNPSPYMFYLDLEDFQIVGASPELLVKVETDGTVTTHPIAGTRRRGATPEQDQRLERELLADEKERAEHIMLVDLGRNDVNRVCDPKTVRVDSLMHIEKYSHVMHIVSNVSGRLRRDKTAFDAFRSIFPAGTVSGAPKVRAMELIYSLEKERRGIYAGAVGYWGYSGAMDTGIAIRTMLFKDGIVYLQAGAGIVHDSQEQAEWEETVTKLRGNVTAIDTAEIHFSKIHSQEQLKQQSNKQ